MRTVHLSLLWLTSSLAIAATSISRVVELNGRDYFLPPIAPWSLKLNSSDNGYELLPLTVVQTNATQITAQVLLAALEGYNRTDDVWTASFASAIYIDYIGDSPPSSNVEKQSFGSGYGLEPVIFNSWDYGSPSGVIPGPYFLDFTSGKVYQAYGLFPDTNQAFIQATYQDESDAHYNLKAGGVSAGGLSIAVPSRLYYTRTEEQPLAGIRLSVKDLYDLKGVKTSGGNRALFEMNTPANETAAAVQTLIDAGAVVIGKNKLSEFAFAGQYHLDHIDYLLPFNPRGDGYNSPGDSSGGSAASVASYDWLDVSMGSDTGGSIRGPALTNGIFGNRPSQDAVSLEGALPLSTSMDTSGTLARDPELWAAVNKVLYNDTTKEYSSFPGQVYLVADYNMTDLQQGAAEGDPSAIALFDFITGLTKYLNATIDNLSLDVVWNKTIPHSPTGNATLADAVDIIYGNLTTYEQWTSFGAGYLKAYTSTHDGDLPYVAYNTVQGWLEANATQTEASHEEDLKWKQAVVDFASNEVFLVDEKSCANSILIYPSVQQKFYKPNFDPNGVIGDLGSHDTNPYILAAFEERDRLALEVEDLMAQLAILNGTQPSTNTKNSLPSPPPQTAPGRFASVAGLPDYAITIGTAVLSQNYSNRTMSDQSLPVGVDIVSRHGCDFMVQNLITKLFEEGILRGVKTGSTIY